MTNQAKVILTATLAVAVAILVYLNFKRKNNGSVNGSETVQASSCSQQAQHETIMAPQSKLVENFMPPLSYKVDKVYDSTGNGDFVSVPGTFQSMVPPRFGMLNGAVVSVPTTDGTVGLNVGNKLDVGSMAFDPSQPLQQGIMDANGDFIQPVVYDRLIYANKKSRLRGEGDFIRGDLPIFPQNLGWFSPSVQPHIDLRTGIVDNFDSDTANQLKLLQMKSEGKFDRAFQGEFAATPNTIIPSYGTFINPSIGDVEVINFE